MLFLDLPRAFTERCGKDSFGAPFFTLTDEECLGKYTGCGQYLVAISDDGRVVDLQKHETVRDRSCPSKSGDEIRAIVSSERGEFATRNPFCRIYRAEGSCTQLMEFKPAPFPLPALGN